jgi:uncharacterized SAM-binding protein YcdF (DUF218 family)
MSLDWLKSISARVGIEGRNVVIVAGLLFCGFCFWLLDGRYQIHPLLSWIFLGCMVLLACAIILIGLLVRPQPSEIAEKFLLQQIGQQIFLAGGFQSPADLIDLLREAHNIQNLPPPSAIVKGSAANEADYVGVSAQEAEQLALKDRDGVQRNIRREADRLLSSLGVQQIAGGTPKQPTPSSEQPQLESPKDKE